jgi:hypothetical protein
VLLPANKSDAALLELQLDRSNVAQSSSSCNGPGGTTQLEVAVGRAPQQAKDQHGIYCLTCCHENCACSFEMHRHESITGHVLLALVLAFALGCNFYFNDVMCILRSHIRAQGGRDLTSALVALLGSLEVESELAACIRAALPVVEVISKDFATFAVSSTGPKITVAPGTDRAPSSPADFDISCLVLRLLERTHQTGQLRSLVGAIPALHAFLHQCNFGAYATPNAGAGHEYSRCYAVRMLCVMFESFWLVK